MFKKLVMAYDHRANSKIIDKVKAVLNENNVENIEILDSDQANDYPILAQTAYLKMKKSNADGMILLCGTGIGMNIVANKFDGIRSVLATSEEEAYFSRRHENANCIVFAAGYSDKVKEIKCCIRKLQRMLKTFLTTEFEGDRHILRVKQIEELEKHN